jgi:hypothetical protein
MQDPTMQTSKIALPCVLVIPTKDEVDDLIDGVRRSLGWRIAQQEQANEFLERNDTIA